MSKKEQTITGTSKIYGNLEKAAKPKKMQPPTSEAEKTERKAAGKTQGRTGCKADRINLLFTVENYDFIRKYSRFRGETMTGFVNHIIEDYRERNKAEFDAFEKFLKNT